MIVLLRKNLTIEELLDWEEKLRDDDSEQNGKIAELIFVYEQLLRKIKADPDSEYLSSVESIKNKLLYLLIQHGTYLKTVNQKDDNAAKMCLKKALSYERNLPVVHYRLGFIHYKEENYRVALRHFQSAIELQMHRNTETYLLNQQQSYNAHLFLANCGLFIAKNAQEALEEFELDVRANIPRYSLSPYYELIKENEQILEKNAYQIIFENGSFLCSKDECEQQLERENTIILDLTGRQNFLVFNHREKSLSKNQAEILRMFLLKSEASKPLTKRAFYDLFMNGDVSGEIPSNTYIQNVRRLRNKLAEVGVGGMVIENSNVQQETAYFYNHTYPFLIMHRSDESFILSE